MGKKEYPETLYVHREEAGSGEEWLRAEEQPHDLADIKEPKKQIGIYQLVGMGELVTEVTMRPTPAEEGQK